MKVLEKYLTMTVEEQIADYVQYIKSMGGEVSVEKVFERLNSEVTQDPLEKLGWESKGENVWEINYPLTQKINICECIDQKLITITNCDGHNTYIKEDELKAVLEIMEVSHE